MKKDNRGLSLLEMIVVITIMAIITGGVVLSVGLISKKNVDKCAERIKQAIQSNRSVAMGRYDSKLEIYVSGDDIYACQYMKRDASSSFAGELPSQVGSSDLILTVTLWDGASYTDYAFGTPGGMSKLILQFDRSSGALKPCSSEMGSAYAGKYCTKITISNGTKKKELTISYLTGKVELK